MSKRAVLITLVIASLAMLSFVLGFVCWQLGLALWAGLMYRLAGLGMLIAFSSLLLLGLLSLLASLGHDLRVYFSAEARALRRLLSLRVRCGDQRLRMFEQVKQLRFWARIKRQRLLARDDQRHLRALFLAIDAELNIAKAQLTARHYQALRKVLRHHLKQADIEAMLALREQLSCR